MLYGIKDSSNNILKSNDTGKQVLYSDYANSFDISFTGDTTYALKKGVKAIGFDGKREGTCKMSMQVFDLKWLSILMGSDFVDRTSYDVDAKPEILTVTGSNTVTITGSPKTGSLAIFKYDKGEQGVEQTVGTPASSPNTYSVDGTGKIITLNSTSCPVGSQVICYYITTAAKARTFTVTADKYPSGYTLTGFTTIKGDNNVPKSIQYRMNNVKPKPNMTLNFSSENVTTLDVEFDIFADSNNDMFTYIEV